MILGLEHIDPQRLAAIDSCGACLKYADITTLSQQVTALIPTRSLCFLLVENNVGGIAWIMAMLESRQLIPLILNVKTEETLYKQLLDTYPVCSIRFVISVLERCEFHALLLFLCRNVCSLLHVRSYLS